MSKPPGRVWLGNLFRRPVSVTGIDQRAQGYVGAIDRQVNRALQGQSGAFRGGTTADPAFRFNGYVGYMPLAVTATVGASSNLRGDPNVALPTTGGPLVVSTATPSGAVMSSLALLPPGTR